MVNSEREEKEFTVFQFSIESFEGTGLGLFICKSIIEDHGNKILVENINNEDGEKGDTF